MITSLGQTDEIVAREGAADDIPGALGPATGTGYFPRERTRRGSTRPRGLRAVDGVAPAIIEEVAVQDATSAADEPQLTLFATDPAAHGRASAQITSAAAGRSRSTTWAAGEVFLNAKAADELDASTGRPVDRLRRRSVRRPATVRGVVRYDGTGTADAARADAARRRRSTLLGAGTGPARARSPTAATSVGRRADRPGRRSAASRRRAARARDRPRSSRTGSTPPTRRAARSCRSSRPSARSRSRPASC